MKPSRHLLSIAFLLSTSLAQAAGFGFIEVPADKDGPALKGAVWSPCTAQSERIKLDPLVIDGVRNCSIAGTGLPLIVVSHGTGGSALGHHDTAAALADAGFVVASVNHPGDNFQDLSRQGLLSAFATRPVDMRRLVDYMLGAWSGRTALDANKVGIFGFSRGGYTALATIGAVPNWTLRADLCPAGTTLPLCEEVRRNELPAPPVRDLRIKAAVIADPLSVFDREGLKQVSVPVQLWASARGGDGVTPESVETVRRGLPTEPDWHVAASAEHFAFLAPCSPAMANMAPAICRDLPPFDRVAFHAAFNAKVIAFLRRNVGQLPTSP